MVNRAEAVRRLRVAFHKNDLILYLGAGASSASYVPTWYDLVLTVYLNSLRIRGRNDPVTAPVIQATGERWFARTRVPLEVATRELRTSFRDSADFLRWVAFGLYQYFEFDSHGYPTRNVHSLIRRNQTLQAIVKLCRHTKPGHRGLDAIVNYNLDGLLELALGSYPMQSIWRNTRVKSGQLPIYHVHGYIPVRDPFRGYTQRTGSSPEEIVLTEDDYHRQSMDPYSWSNLVQLQAMSSSMGLTLGLSLSDPNLRRLLDAANRAPHRPEIYAVLQKPEETELEEAAFQQIATNTERLLNIQSRFYQSPLPPLDVKSAEWRKRVRHIWLQLERVTLDRQVSVLRELGIEPLWCQYAEIPSIVRQIVNG